MPILSSASLIAAQSYGVHMRSVRGGRDASLAQSARVSRAEEKPAFFLELSARAEEAAPAAQGVRETPVALQANLSDGGAGVKEESGQLGGSGQDGAAGRREVPGATSNGLPRPLPPGSQIDIRV